MSDLDSHRRLSALGRRVNKLEDGYAELDSVVRSPMKVGWVDARKPNIHLFLSSLRRQHYPISINYRRRKNRYIEISDYTTNRGIAIMMEHLSPGKGGRHRQTLSYGKSPDLTLSPRQALAQEIWDVRSIYLRQGLHNLDIKKSLQKLIKLNKETWLNVFDKGVI